MITAPRLDGHILLRLVERQIRTAIEIHANRSRAVRPRFWIELHLRIGQVSPSPVESFAQEIAREVSVEHQIAVGGHIDRQAGRNERLAPHSSGVVGTILANQLLEKGIDSLYGQPL